ncbi:kinase-like domain-containing protein [Lyophyllum atratum]|nr:kinase-like domain-containing protein [Lyophyllum atratum]
MLSDKLFAEGETKDVYKLMIDRTCYVAKRFKSGPVPEADNASYLKQELIRLRQGQWFWTQFQALTKQKGVDICHDIQFSDSFLIRVSNPDDDDDSIWLVEPCHTTSIIKFSGTLQYPARADKMGKTIGKSLVFAVLSKFSESPVSMNNRDGVVLYDLMSHSVIGDSGIGDHGKVGMKSFLDQHKCNFMCESLGLTPPVVATTSDDSDGDSS